MHPGLPAGVREFAVIQPGAAHRTLVEAEPQRLDEVQPRARVGAEPDDVAGVGRDLGFVQDDVQHRRRIVARATGQRKEQQRSCPAWV